MTTKKQELQTYRNFAAVIGVLFFMIITVLIIGSLVHYLGIDPKLADDESFSKGYSYFYSLGYTLGKFVSFYVPNGFIYGNLIAIIASITLHKSIPKAIVHGALGWGYVIYFAVTRKTVTPEAV